MSVADFLHPMDPPLPPHTTGDLPGSNRDSPRHAQPRPHYCGWRSLQNVPERTYWVLCCICLVCRHGCPLARTQWEPSIGAEHPTLWAVARPHIGMRDTPSEALPECCLRDVRGISLRRIASPRGGVCDFELMDRSWSARDEEPTRWHTYLEAQSPQVCAPGSGPFWGAPFSRSPLL